MSTLRALVAILLPMAVGLFLTPMGFAEATGEDQACVHVVTGRSERSLGPYYSLSPVEVGVSTGSQMYGVEVNPANCLTAGNPVATMNNYESYDEWPDAFLP